MDDLFGTGRKVKVNILELRIKEVEGTGTDTHLVTVKTPDGLSSSTQWTVGCIRYRPLPLGRPTIHSFSSVESLVRPVPVNANRSNPS